MISDCGSFPDAKKPCLPCIKPLDVRIWDNRVTLYTWKRACLKLKVKASNHIGLLRWDYAQVPHWLVADCHQGTCDGDTQSGRAAFFATMAVRWPWNHLLDWKLVSTARTAPWSPKSCWISHLVSLFFSWSKIGVKFGNKPKFWLRKMWIWYEDKNRKLMDQPTILGFQSFDFPDRSWSFGLVLEDWLASVENAGLCAGALVRNVELVFWVSFCKHCWKENTQSEAKARAWSHECQVRWWYCDKVHTQNGDQLSRMANNRCKT